jgi:hypothetical protein
VYTRLLWLPIATVLLLASACGGDDDPAFSGTTVISPDQVTPVIVNSEIVVGPNRMTFAVVAPEGRLIVDAKVHLIFYELVGATAEKRFEMDAVSRVPARDAGIEELVDHIHGDGSRHTHVSVNDQTGFYTAVATFDKATDWGVAMQVDSEEPKFSGELRTRFNVLAQGSTPPIGSPAPRSRNLIAADVSDISQIDSSVKPSTELHTATIADTIAAGKPALVLFAVPGYCTSALCGPEMEIMRKLAPQYAGKAEFIHVEFYKDPGTNRVLSDPAVEWNLRSEPWFFVIDKQGNISAKFEGPAAMQELDEALKAVLQPS